MYNSRDKPWEKLPLRQIVYARFKEKMRKFLHFNVIWYVFNSVLFGNSDSNVHNFFVFYYWKAQIFHPLEKKKQIIKKSLIIFLWWDAETFSNILFTFNFGEKSSFFLCFFCFFPENIYKKNLIIFYLKGNASLVKKNKTSNKCVV